MEDKLVRSEEEWKAQLTPEQYRVLREKGTEPAFTGAYNEVKTQGTYACAGCGAALFASGARFDSGTGWPSFYEPIEDQRLHKEPDFSTGTERTEVMCRRCGGHLGHVFEDGPEPTGLRYCLNAVSLKLDEKRKGTPE